MKKVYIVALLTVTCLWTISSIEQENEQLIIPKNKKKYISREQCLETKLDSPVLINRFNKSINSLRETVDTIQEEDFDMLNEYADGEKNGFFKRADKIGLTQYHEKQKQFNDVIELYTKKIQKMQHNLYSLHLEMKKIQKGTE
jgi:hypothetical protein